MPPQEALNPLACACSSAVVDKRRCIWVWAGGAAPADCAPVADPRWSGDARHAGDGEPITPPCGRRLGVQRAPLQLAEQGLPDPQ